MEAEGEVFAYARAHDVFQKAVLMAWSALAEASRMILDRGDEARIEPNQAESRSAKPRARFPAVAVKRWELKLFSVSSQHSRLTAATI